MDKIAAGIVLFNPEIERFSKVLESILNQVERVYIYDNCPKEYFFEDHEESITYMTENDNKGLAHGLNCIMEKAYCDGYEWLITMDQDSLLPPNAVGIYEKYISNEKDIAIVCPQVIDSRRSYMKIKTDPKYEYVDFCITSASCTNLSVWKNVGRFDEWLFIDLIDNDFCKRLRVSNHKILRINEIVLDQEFGKIIPKSIKKQVFWNKIAHLFHNNNFAKFGYKKIVNPIRVYYTCRNIIYVNKKLRKYGKTGYKENYNCKGEIGFLICFVIPSILRAQNKKEVIKAVLNGFNEGRKKKVSSWATNGQTL